MKSTARLAPFALLAFAACGVRSSADEINTPGKWRLMLTRPAWVRADDPCVAKPMTVELDLPHDGAFACAPGCTCTVDPAVDACQPDPESLAGQNCRASFVVRIDCEAYSGELDCPFTFETDGWAQGTCGWRDVPTSVTCDEAVTLAEIKRE